MTKPPPPRPTEPELAEWLDALDESAKLSPRNRRARNEAIARAAHARGVSAGLQWASKILNGEKP